MRCSATNEQKVSLIRNTKNATCVARFYLVQTQNPFVKIAGTRKVLYEKRGFDETVKLRRFFSHVISFLHFA